MTGKADHNEQIKQQIIAALIQYIRGQGRLPRIEDVAQMANLSRRTIYRYFSDRNTLMEEMENFIREHIREKFPLPELVGKPLEQRIEEICDHMARVYEYLMPVRMVADEKKNEFSFIRSKQKEVHGEQKKRIEYYFSDVLPQDPAKAELVIDEIQAVTSINMWIFLNNEKQYSIDRTKRIIAGLLKKIMK